MSISEHHTAANGRPLLVPNAHTPLHVILIGHPATLVVAHTPRHPADYGLFGG